MPFPSNEQIEPSELLLEIAKTEGEQTKITENIKHIADEIDPDNKLSGIELVLEVCSYVRTMLPKQLELDALYTADPNKVFDKRARSADELLSIDNLLPDRRRVRNISGCIETAVITRALLLAKGCPSIYTETLQEGWCEQYGKKYTPDDPSIPAMEGHVFIDIYLEDTDEWKTIDSNDSESTVHTYGDYSKNGKKYIFPLSAKDSWDLGYNKMIDFQKAVADYFKSKDSQY